MKKTICATLATIMLLTLLVVPVTALAAPKASNGLGPIVGEPLPDVAFNSEGWRSVTPNHVELSARRDGEIFAWRGMNSGNMSASSDIIARQYSIAKLINEGNLNNAGVAQLNMYANLASFYPFSGTPPVKESGICAYSGVESWSTRLDKQLAFAKKLWEDKYGVAPTNNDLNGPPRDPSLWIDGIKGIDNPGTKQNRLDFMNKYVFGKGIKKDTTPLPGKGSAPAATTNPTPSTPAPGTSAPIPTTPVNPSEQGNIYAGKMIVKSNVTVNKKVVLRKNEIVDVVSVEKSYIWVTKQGNPDAQYKVSKKNLADGQVTKISNLPKTLSLKVGEFKKLKWKLNSPVLTDLVNCETSNDAVCRVSDDIDNSNALYFEGVAAGTCTLTFTPEYGSAKVIVKVTVR